MTGEHKTGAMTSTRAEAIVAYLKGEGIRYELIEHEPVMSATAEARVAQRPPDEVAKTVVLHDGNAYVVVAIPASNHLDLHKLRELLGATRQLRLASEAEIAATSRRSKSGAVPAIRSNHAGRGGDRQRAVRRRQILCPAGDHSHSVLVDPRDAVRVTAAKIADISEE